MVLPNFFNNILLPFLGIFFMAMAILAMTAFMACGVILALGLLDWILDTNIKGYLARRFPKKTSLKKAKNASNRILEGLEKAGNEAAKYGRE